MLVNRVFLGGSVRAGVRRWLPAITHSPVPRRPLIIATALSAAAAVAAGGSAVSPEPAERARIVTVPAADAAGTRPAGAGVASAGAAAGPADRAAKVAAARDKASRAKAERARALAPTRPGAESERPALSGAAPDRPAKPGKAGKAGRGKRSAAPSARELMPAGTPGGQSSFTPSKEQVRNAERIVRTGERMNMPPRAHVIAVATALQESKLQNLGHLGARNDHDSLGLFQQRPSSGWGTPAQVTDPDYSAEQFYRGLARVPGYQNQPLTVAAQTVQVSAFPDAYAQWEKMAADLVLAAHGVGPYAAHGKGRN